MYVLELVGEDDAFAAYEAAALAEDVEVVDAGVASATAIDPLIARAGFTRRTVERVATASPVVDAIERAAHAVDVDRSGTVAVRARSIRGGRIDSAAVERAVGAVLVARGLDVDLESPDHEFHVIVSRRTAHLGWLVASGDDDFSARRPTDRPFFQPGSMAPRLARALAILAGARPEVTILDPMCGTGGIVLEAALVGATAVGTDVQEQMVRGTRENCRTLAHGRPVHVCRADVTRLPIRRGPVDGVAFDAPYGRQSRIAARETRDLLTDALAAIGEITDSAVVVTDAAREDPIADTGWRIRASFRRRVHRSLTRHIYHLDGT